MRFEWDSGVDDIILPSTDMTSTHLFILPEKPPVVQNIAFHITPTATY